MRLALLSLCGLCALLSMAFGKEASSPGQTILDYLHARGEAMDITAPAPVKAVYIDWRAVNWNAPDQNVKDIANAGFNVIILAFYLTSGPTDMLQAWASLPAATQQAAVAYAHSKGAVVMLTAGGSSEVPFSSDAKAYGTAVAAAAGKLNLDGVDFDLENLSEGCKTGSLSDQQVVDWMVTATHAARAVLGASGLLTHAPQAPYFGSPSGSGSNPWTGPTGCYSAVNKQAGDDISWYNMQFYNQGPTCYTTYPSLFVAANGTGECTSFPGTAVREIVAYGVPLSKIVIGKPLDSGDAGSGYVSPADLHTFFTDAGQHGLAPPGVMAWSWDPSSGQAWINAVYP